MSRAIKFRVWSIDCQRFLESDNDVSFSLRHDGSLLKNKYCNVSLMQHGDRLISEIISAENYIITQFTGLHDKNGKEIYEGDIVNYGGRIEAVKFEICNDSVGGHGECFAYSRAGFCLSGYGRGDKELSECEVLGNVYENPELLNKGIIK